MTRPGAPLSSLFGRAIAHAATEPAPSEDATVLDAALTVLAERGTRLATMDDVAAISGVSRATLFRRFGGKDRLFELALAHDLRLFLDSIATTFRSVTDPTERIAEAFVSCVQLRNRFISTESGPERGWELLSVLSHGDPCALDLGRNFIAAHIVAGHNEGVLPRNDAELQADALIRLTLGYLVIPSPHIDLDDPAVARDVARRTIAPLVTR